MSDHVVSVSERLPDIGQLKAFIDGLFNHAPVGFAVYSCQGQCLTVNQTFVELLGSVPPPEYNLFEDEQAERLGVLATLRKSFAGETVTTPICWYDPRELEKINITVGKRVAISLTSFPIYAPDGQIEYVVVTYRDHTDEVLARERTESERDRFRALFESILDGIVILNAQGLFVEANPAACRLLGREADSLPGLSYLDVCADPQSVPPRWEEFLAQGCLSGVSRLLRPDGELRLIEYELTSNFERGLYLSILRDITEKEQLRLEREKLAAQLRQAQKIEAIGRMAGSVAHDFNNLLTVINGYTELLLADHEGPDPTAESENETIEALEQIYQAGQQAAALTSQLLAFGRKSILQPLETELNPILRKLDKMLQRLLREDIELEIRLAEDLGRILIDPSQFEQVVMNLVLNARDAMPTGGLLLIQTAAVDLNEHYDQTHAEVKPGRYVMLAVSDNGAGMDEVTRQQIFEPFFTTKDQQGTGLGLSTVHGIVRQSGGHIFVYSEPEHGTTFKVYFPCVSEEAPPASAPSTELSLPGGKETVLLVEDVAAVRHFARLVLESCGYRVLEAASGPEAIERYSAETGNISLLISDVIMPRLSGPQLATTLQALNPRLRVMYISGYTDDAVLRYGILNTGIPFLAKPFTPSKLAHKVRDVLDGLA